MHVRRPAERRIGGRVSLRNKSKSRVDVKAFEIMTIRTGWRLCGDDSDHDSLKLQPLRASWTGDRMSHEIRACFIPLGTLGSAEL